MGKSDIVDQANLVKSNVFRKEFVEGAIAECIAQIKYSLDALCESRWAKNAAIKGVRPVEAVKATFLVAANEAASIITILENYTDASLSPKHRYARYVIKTFVRRMKALGAVMDAKRMHKKEVSEFARLLVDFLCAIHITMLEETRHERRVSTMSEFCDGDLEEDGAALGAKVITIH
jgi:hypothetical protein